MNIQQHQGTIQTHNHAQATVDPTLNPNFSLVAVAVAASMQDMSGGHLVTAQQLENMMNNMSNGMINDAVAGVLNHSETWIDVRNQLIQDSIYGQNTEFQNTEFAGHITDAQANYAIELVGQNLGYHLPFGGF